MTETARFTLGLVLSSVTLGMLIALIIGIIAQRGDDDG